MKISTKGRYGLRLMIALGVNYGQGPISADTLAAAQGISAKYIHVLMAGLRSAGLVRTIRGPNGGYECTCRPDSVSVADILSVLEGDMVPADCATDSTSCSRNQRCATHQLWLDVAQKIHKTFSQTTLAELVKDQLALDNQSTG